MKRLFTSFLLGLLLAVSSSSYSTTYVNASGSWIELTEVYVNNSGDWESIDAIYVNVGGTWEIVFMDDDEAPSTVQVDSSSGNDTVTLFWPSASDNVGVAYYNIYRCTGSSCTPNELNIFDTDTASPYVDSTVNGGTIYGYRVQAVDFADNKAQSSPLIEYAFPF